MNARSLKILFGIFILTAISINYLMYRTRHGNNESVQINLTQDPSEQFLKELQQNEVEIWNLITTHTGITYEQCLDNQQKHFKEETELYKKSNQQQLKRKKKLSPTLQHVITKVFQDFNVDPSLIDIVPYKGNGSPAAADDWTLFIDEQDLLSYPYEAQCFVLGHEIVHIQEHDHSILCALLRLVKKKNKKIQSVLHSYERFQETRADLMSMLKKDIYLKGALSFLGELQIREKGWVAAPSHPQIIDRIAWAERVDSFPEKMQPISANNLLA